MNRINNSMRKSGHKKILDFSSGTADLLLPIDFDTAMEWWKSLNHDWKITMVYNHNYNYGRLGPGKINDFESVIKDVEFAARDDQEIFFAECKAIKIFICSFYDGAYGIDDLSQVYYLENIEKLHCKYIKVENMNAIGSLVKLKLAELHETDLKSLELFGNLKKLEHLTVEGTKISSLEGIEGLGHLRNLNASMTQISTLEPLRALDNLEYLSCFRTNISSLEPIGGLEKLKTLHCYSNQVNNLDALENLRLLEDVNLSRTQVRDLTPLKNNKGLNKVTIRGTQVSHHDIALLEGLLPRVLIVR